MGYEQIALLNVPATAHLDRISVVGKIPYMDRWINKHSSNYYLLDMKEGKFPYDYYCRTVGGAWLGIASRYADMPNFRFDFNPSNVGEVEKQEIMKLFADVKNLRVTRLDIAIDYVGFDLGNVEWIENRSRKRQEWRSGKGRLETLYMGSFKSNNLIRIYDKQLESKLDYPMWRVESQARYKKGDKPFLHNPFDGLMGRARAPSKRMSMSECAMLEYLRGHPLEIAALDAHTRAKYRALMKEQAIENELTPSPADVFEKEKGKLSAELTQWLKACYTASKQA